MRSQSVPKDSRTLHCAPFERLLNGGEAFKKFISVPLAVTGRRRFARIGIGILCAVYDQKQFTHVHLKLLQEMHIFTDFYNFLSYVIRFKNVAQNIDRET